MSKILYCLKMKTVAALLLLSNVSNSQVESKKKSLAPIDSILSFFNLYNENKILTKDQKYAHARIFNPITFNSFDHKFIDTLLLLLKDNSACYYTESSIASVYACTSGLDLSTMQIEVTGLVIGLMNGRFPYNLFSCKLVCKRNGKIHLKKKYKSKAAKWLKHQKYSASSSVGT